MVQHNTLKQLLEDRADKETELEKTVDIGKNRHYTDEEKDRIYRLERELEELNKTLAPLQAIEEKSKKLAVQKSMKTNGIEIDELEEKFLDFQIKKSVPVNRSMPATDYVLRNHDVEDWMQKVSVYSVIAGLAGKKFKAGSPTDNALEQVKRSLTSSALLNPYLSAQLLDGGLSKSRLVEAGMKTFAMVQGEHKFARIAAYPIMEWKAELDSTTERTITFDNVTFDAKTLRGWVQLGGETLQDAMNIESALRTVFSRALANGIDTAGLIGAGGAVEPLGIANYIGVPTVPWNSTLENYDPWVAAQKLVYEADGPDLTATIMSPDAWSQIARLKGTAEFQPVQPPFFLQNHKFLQTSKIEADGSSETLAILGGFESLNLGVRLEAQITLTPVIAETFSYKMLAVFRGDFQPNRVEDFAVITDISEAPALT